MRNIRITREERRVVFALRREGADAAKIASALCDKFTPAEIEAYIARYVAAGKAAGTARRVIRQTMNALCQQRSDFHSTCTAAVFGDPLPGRSALDKLRASGAILVA